MPPAPRCPTDADQPQAPGHSDHGDRLAFDATLKAAVRAGAATLFLLDLDHVTSVGDGFGLRPVVLRLRRVTGPMDRIFRLDARTFALLTMAASDPLDAVARADEVHLLLAETSTADAGSLALRTSIGVAVAPLHAKSADQLLLAADMALHAAKRAGRGATRLASHASAVRRRIETGGMEWLTLRTKLREALLAPEPDQFEAYFQPVLDLDQGHIAWHEALVRWNPPGGPQIGPAAFVPIAEDSGLVAHLDLWMLGRACTIASRWSMPWRVSVNISPVTIGLLDVVELVRDTLRRTGLHPGRLAIEVTETAALPNRERMLSTINGLRQLGVAPSLDDFGAGHASLAHLRHYAFDLVKTDRCFVKGLGSDPRAAPVFQALVRLARSLAVLLVAEGVETEEQLLILYRLGVQSVQGFLLARPVPADQIEQAAERAIRKLAHVLKQHGQRVGGPYANLTDRTLAAHAGALPNAGVSGEVAARIG